MKFVIATALIVILFTLGNIERLLESILVELKRGLWKDGEGK